MGKYNPVCIGSKMLGGEIVSYRRLPNTTDLPPPRTIAEGSSKVAPKQTFRPATCVVIRKPAPTDKTTTELAPTDKAPIRETESQDLPHLSNLNATQIFHLLPVSKLNLPKRKLSRFFKNLEEKVSHLAASYMRSCMQQELLK